MDMNFNNRKILEALRMQPLSEEEMAARHILGRLYGPIATCVESTRNGRLYNKPLWEKALKDEIFLEKVATKALFLELGHPADREETDMKQACACIPEVPKIVGDELYAYVDILDTPNGRLLKTLVDYGFVPGISSRGSGDVMDNNQVDPETFFLETWDIVQLPAVKKARLNVCESLDSNSVRLKKALAESYNAAKEEDKDTMKEALENLNIDIEQEIEQELSTANKVTDENVLTADDIPWDPEADEPLLEEMPAEEADEVPEAEEESAEEAEEDSESYDEEPKDEPVEDTEDQDDELSDEKLEDSNSKAKIIDVTGKGEAELNTVSDAIELLQEYDDDIEVEFELTTPDGKTAPVEAIESFVDDDTLILNVKSCEEAEEEISDDADSNIETETKDDVPPVETIEEVDDNSKEADDDGDVEVIESLKDMVRLKEALKTEVGNLSKAKAVSDAKVEELQEKLLRYQKAYKSTSSEAAKAVELQSKVDELTEQLAQSNKKIERLTDKVKNARQLKESADRNEVKISRLTEEVSRLNKKSEALAAKLEGQTKQYTEKLQERTDLAKSYKARFIETLTKYVESKASMLGVKPSEITSRLNESYTLTDVDAVCDQILESTVNYGRLPFSGRTKTSARITESVSRPNASSFTDPAYGYEIDDSLLELAGLKK